MRYATCGVDAPCSRSQDVNPHHPGPAALAVGSFLWLRTRGYGASVLEGSVLGTSLGFPADRR